MNNGEALRIVQEYYDTQKHGSDEEFAFTEALKYLMEETRDSKYMLELAWHYCREKRFDLEEKYLEMAAECGSKAAMEELGFLWFHGQNGETDYEKAFHYFSAGAEGEDGSLWCRYKLADMYKYGLYVSRDETRYREMIEEAYEQVKDPKFLNDPLPEISLRLAGIRTEQGDRDEAIRLLKEAKRFMAERLSQEPFWGHLEDMGKIVSRLYELQTFDEEASDFYDLFYLTKRPGRYAMKRKGKKVEIVVTDEDGEMAIGFGGRWYRDFGDFCQKAETENHKFTRIYDEFYDLEVAR